MAKTGDYAIPFHPITGAQMHWADPYIYERVGDFTRKMDIDWQQNHEFEDTLTYTGFSRGRSAAYVLFKRSDGREVTAFLKELDELLPRLCGGHVTGRFTFIKRGANYGVRALPLA